MDSWAEVICRRPLTKPLAPLDNTHICPDVVAVDSPENPHRIDIYIWHLIPDFLLSMLNAISTTHQIIRSQPINVLLTDNTATYSEGSAADKQVTRLESFHHPLITKVYRYQHQALQGINGCLQIMQTELTDMAIALIALLLMAQVTFILTCVFILQSLLTLLTGPTICTWRLAGSLEGHQTACRHPRRVH